MGFIPAVIWGGERAAILLLIPWPTYHFVASMKSLLIAKFVRIGQATNNTTTKASSALPARGKSCHLAAVATAAVASALSSLVVLARGGVY